MQDEEPLVPDDEVEEALAILESGRQLPPNPREAGVPRESAESFVARMHKIKARYEAQFLKRKEWEVRQLRTIASLNQSSHSVCPENSEVAHLED